MNVKRYVILLLSLLIFFSTGGYLIRYFYNSLQSKEDISELRQLVENTDEPQADEGSEKEIPQKEQYASNGMLSGYYNAYQKNSDMIGWIKIDGTDIDYPVMQSDDNEFYLHKNFEKEYRYSGLPFLDYQCDINKPSDNLIIYAHNMKDGSMFADLLNYEDKEFYENHSVINFDTNYERGQYKIFAAFEVKSEAEFQYHKFTEFEDKDKFLEFMTTVKKNMLYKTDESVSYGDKILTLSTCSYNRSNERMVVIAKKIQ